jgi:Ca2+/Na+ antiporter
MMVGAASVVTAGATGLGPAVGLPLMMISGLLAFMSSWPEFSTMKSLLAQGEVRKSVDVASGSNAINLILALGVMGMRGGKL